MPDKANILIIHPDGIVAELLADHLDRNGMRGTPADPEAIAAHLAAPEAVDAVLLDPDALGAPTAELHAVVRQVAPAPVILFAGRTRWESIDHALDLGVRGYIPKNAPLRTFLNAVRLVLAGESYVPADLIPATGGAGGVVLTRREIDVLRQIRLGRMNKEIAQSLGLSLVTVKMHVRAVCSKLSARNRTQAAMIAAQLLRD